MVKNKIKNALEILQIISKIYSHIFYFLYKIIGFDFE